MKINVVLEGCGRGHCRRSAWRAAACVPGVTRKRDLGGLGGEGGLRLLWYLRARGKFLKIKDGCVAQQVGAEIDEKEAEVGERKFPKVGSRAAGRTRVEEFRKEGGRIARARTVLRGRANWEQKGR